MVEPGLLSVEPYLVEPVLLGMKHDAGTSAAKCGALCSGTSIADVPCS
jgi:hypothetical protein